MSYCMPVYVSDEVEILERTRPYRLKYRLTSQTIDLIEYFRSVSRPCQGQDTSSNLVIRSNSFIYKSFDNSYFPDLPTQIRMPPVSLPFLLH